MVWGRSKRDRQVVERFVEAVNARDVDTLVALMSPDFTYIDSWREGVTGRDLVIAAWNKLLTIDPAFQIEVARMDWRDPVMLMTGKLHSREFGARRAVWQVTVRDGLVAEYQAWAEGGPPPMSRMLAPDHVRDMAARAAEHPMAEDGD